MTASKLKNAAIVTSFALMGLAFVMLFVFSSPLGFAIGAVGSVTLRLAFAEEIDQLMASAPRRPIE